MMLVNYLLNQLNSIDGTKGSRLHYHQLIYEKVAK